LVCTLLSRPSLSKTFPIQFECGKKNKKFLAPAPFFISFLFLKEETEKISPSSAERDAFATINVIMERSTV
jgi:hypothetical protein